MNIRMIKLLSLAALCICSLSVFAKLSDYQKFVSYPYLEKSYRLQAEGRYSDAIEELKKAIDHAPDHPPFQVLLFELLIANQQTDQALDLYATIKNEAKGTLLARLIEIQIENDSLRLTDKLKRLIEETSVEHRLELYKIVANRLIAKGQESLTYEWLAAAKNLSPELQELQMALSDKLEKFDAVKKYYFAIPPDKRTTNAERLYVFSLFKAAKTDEALSFAKQNPNSQLSFDIYYQYLQESIAHNDLVATETAFAWIEQYHQLSPRLLKQRFEHALKSKDREVAFAVMSQLNESCQKRIEVALSLDWQSKAQQEIITCQNTMQESLWLTYADTLLSDQQLHELIANKTKYSTSISKLLIDRYIAQERYQKAVDEIKGANLEKSHTEILALSYEKLGQLELATEQFIILYKSTNSDQYLDKSSFLLVKQDKSLDALMLLEKRLTADPKSMAKGLVERVVQIYQQQPDKLTSPVINSLLKISHAHDMTAEILRLNGNCDKAIVLLNKSDITTSLSWTTRAQCATEKDPTLALQYWQKAYSQTQNKDTLRAIAYAQGNTGNSAAALKSLYELGEQIWTKGDSLYAAQLHYQQKNYQIAETYWLAAKNTSDTWLDFGIELAIQQQNLSLAQTLSTNLLDLNGQFNAQQWARQATIYQQTNQNDKAIRAWQLANEITPEENIYKLSWAYSLIESQPEKAYQILRELADDAAELDSRVWEQLAYLAAQNNQQENALRYIKKSVETEDQGILARGEQLSWDLHQYYRNLSQNWHFTASFSQGSGAILGEVFFENSDTGELSPPTNNLSSRAEYFFNTTNKVWSVYAQLSGNGTENYPLSEWSQELGGSYRIFDQYNIKASLGAQRFVSGDWKTIARLNGDLFNQGKWRQGWRFDDSWWQRQLYFDLLWLPQSNQLLGLGRFDMAYVEALNTSSKQTIMYYGLAQYDLRKVQLDDPDGQPTYTQSALGLGVKWNLFTTPEIVYERVHTYSLALEWRLNVAGNLTNDNSSVFLIGTYQY